jgi:hypothetical protein
VHDPVVDEEDVPRCSRLIEKRRWCEQAALGMLPPYECLDGDDSSRLETHDGLVVNDELPLFDGALQLRARWDPAQHRRHRAAQRS